MEGQDGEASRCKPVADIEYMDTHRFCCSSLLKLVVPDDRLSLVLVINLLDLLSRQFDITSLDQIIQFVQTSGSNNGSGNERFAQTPS